MLTVVSPAKALDMTRTDVTPTQPAYRADAARLAKTMRNLTLAKLAGLMDLSDTLARLNRDRFRVFADTPEAEATRPAALAFDGDTYKGLDARSLDDADLAWAQDRLRIISGLYGLLRPLDAIQPYRLEMGSRLRTRRGETLYDYWRDTLARALTDHAESLGTDTLVNCASAEYFRAVDRPTLGLRVVTPVFMETDTGQARIVSFHAKRARGAMARHITVNRITDPEGIKGFTTGGYAYSPDDSTPDRPVFLR